MRGPGDQDLAIRLQRDSIGGIAVRADVRGDGTGGIAVQATEGRIERAVVEKTHHRKFVEGPVIARTGQYDLTVIL